MQNFLENSKRYLKKNEKKLLLLKKPIQFQKRRVLPPSKSPEKKPKISDIHLYGIHKKLKEIQLKNQQALNNRRNSSQTPINFLHISDNCFKKVDSLKISLHKEKGFFSPNFFYHSLFFSKKVFQNKIKNNKEIEKNKNLKEKTHVVSKQTKLDLNNSLQDYDSTTYTEKEEVPRELKVKTDRFFKNENKNKPEFLKYFPHHLRIFSPFSEKIPEWKAYTIEKHFEKLNDLMEKTKNARSHLLSIQLGCFDQVEKNL